MKKHLLYLLPALFLAGCANDPPPENDEVQIFTVDELKFLATVGRETRFAPEEIDRIVGNVVDFLNADPSTRSGNSRTVAEIVPLSVNVPRLSTRSGGGEVESSEEELFYTVNFADNEGYSVIAADSRIKDEIVLFVDHGNLDVEFIENP